MTLLDRRQVLAIGAAAMTGMPARGNAQAPATVRMLHIETNKAVLAIWERSAKAFEGANPGVKIEMRGMETGAFKARLPTILQSDTRPHLFYSWGGALVDQQARAGLLEDISGQVDAGYLAKLMPVALDQFTRGGKLFGLPYNTAEIGILINKELFGKAGVAVQDVQTWPGLLRAVRAFKQAGIQPMAGGGQDKWQMMLVYGHLCLRLGGRAAIMDVMAGRNGGFDNPVFVRAGELYKELTDMNPYQDGFMAMKAQSAAGLFADGKAAMLPHGTWFVRQNASYATDKKGLPDDKLNFIGFPTVPGGAGTLRETQVNLNGWLVSKGSPQAATAFLKHLMDAETQGELAAGGFIAPANLAARDKLTHPIMRRAADTVASLDFMQVAYDNLLGPNGGKVADDVAVGIASGRMTPKEAAAALERARAQDAQAS